MRILRAAQHRALPWKNGGGETAEVAIGPEGATADGFDWRVSIAAVARDGPFSAFPGIDRTLCVLAGEGIDLRIGGARPVRLDGRSDPFRFAADADCAARLVEGPITDLNVMSRRDRLTHAVRRIELGGDAEVRASGEAVLLLAASGTVAVGAGADIARLAARDCAMGAGAVRWTLAALEGPAVAYLVTFQPV